MAVPPSPLDRLIPVAVLAGHTTLVTGAGQGIGRGIALALSAAGAQVAAVGRTAKTIGAVADEIVTRGGKAVSFVCDVTDGSAIDALTPAVADEFGGITLLVNNAQTPAPGRLLEIDEETSIWVLRPASGGIRPAPAPTRQPRRRCGC